MDQLSYVVMTILPVFLVIGVGYVAFKREIIPHNGHKSLAAFVFNFGLPAAIFSALSSKPLEQIWNIDYVIAYTLGSLLAFGLVAAIALLKLKKSPSHAVILGLGGSFSNSLLIGFPIIYFLFGTQALIPFSLTLVVENLIMLPLLLTLADMSSRESKGSLKKTVLETTKNLAKNPIVISIVLGMLCSGLNWQTPETATRIIDILASTVTGVALFTIGGGLVGVKLSGMKQEISLVMLAKLVLHPVIVMLCLIGWFELDPTMSAVAVILASMPMFGVYAVIGQRYNLGGMCAAVLLPTTLLAMVTVSVMTTFALTLFQ
ncbi:AEC family transporter [Vibrio vulnificus]|uniref:AEC family transporter n=1 Tax=Vibrio vulnificus TaxID=672 RepID=UPI001A1BA18B|nr:AEC family transporter [Vibrio vulnificus]ELF6257765.1 AEC family transporter [Vibrio vulnificus]ELK8310893.1 AEC family transporter [Vibrio vulnificus]ELL0586880.1 AEC family transporter [Vibrio vulnificus]ELV8710408.1 AEC family transporter [Vibrio vulnificus]MCA3982646.1 AEC family transporter [Vibrio vulnificus]